MLDILAVGDAIVDKVVAFDETDEMMQQILPVKGLFFMATDEEHAYFRNKTALAYYAGGSAANTIRNMSLMGLKTGFVGMVGQDDDGIFFEKSLHEYGVQSYLNKTSQDKTGCSVVIIHQDKDRTQCAKACAASLLNIQNIKDEYLKNTFSVLTEGYMLNRCPELVEHVIMRSKQYGVQTYLTLSDVHCVSNRRELILKLLPYIDIVFGNEYEFQTLNVDKDTLHQTVCVQTCGGNGVRVFSQKESEFFPLQTMNTIVNTNGAGDGFAAGFLASYHQHKNMNECIVKGHQTACHVLQTDLSYLPK